MDSQVEHRESPGTVTLVDINGTIHARHSARLKDIVLDPTPSSDPEDPLSTVNFCYPIYFIEG